MAAPFRHLFGLQTITFGDENQKHLPQILTHARASGYDGVEVGFRRLNGVDAGQLRDWLAEAGVQLAALHLGGNLSDLTQAGGEQKRISSLALYAVEAGAAMINYSGLRWSSEEQFASDWFALREAAHICRDAGIPLCYHNHDWEFASDWRVMRPLIEDDKTPLGFCIDAGWLAKAQVDFNDVFGLVRDRLRMVHLKDFITNDPGTLDTVPLGSGVAPVREVFQWVEENIDSQVWIVSEQDYPVTDPYEEVRVSAEFLLRVRESFEGTAAHE